jgi:hypothetical protein
MKTKDSMKLNDLIGSLVTTRKEMEEKGYKHFAYPTELSAKIKDYFEFNKGDKLENSLENKLSSLKDFKNSKDYEMVAKVSKEICTLAEEIRNTPESGIVARKDTKITIEELMSDFKAFWIGKCAACYSPCGEINVWKKFDDVELDTETYDHPVLRLIGPCVGLDIRPYHVGITPLYRSICGIYTKPDVLFLEISPEEFQEKLKTISKVFVSACKPNTKKGIRIHRNLNLKEGISDVK